MEKGRKKYVHSIFKILDAILEGAASPEVIGTKFREMPKAFLEQEISGFLCSYDAEKLRFPAGRPLATLSILSIY
jgi:hypothetical protein